MSLWFVRSANSLCLRARHLSRWNCPLQRLFCSLMCWCWGPRASRICLLRRLFPMGGFRQSLCSFCRTILIHWKARVWNNIRSWDAACIFVKKRSIRSHSVSPESTLLHTYRQTNLVLGFRQTVCLLYRSKETERDVCEDADYDSAIGDVEGRIAPFGQDPWNRKR